MRDTDGSELRLDPTTIIKTARWGLADDGFALTIGKLNLSWTAVELAVRQLFVRITRMPNDQTGDLVARCIDFRDQLAAIKVAAVASRRSRALVDEIVTTVDFIDGTLRPRRNRVIHDHWLASDVPDFASRTTLTPKIARPQAHKRRRVRIDRSREHFLDVTDAQMFMWVYAEYVAEIAEFIGSDRPGPLRTLLAKRPRWHRAPRPDETPRPAGKRAPKRKPPRQPSEG